MYISEYLINFSSNHYKTKCLPFVNKKHTMKDGFVIRSAASDVSSQYVEGTINYGHGFQASSYSDNKPNHEGG